MVIRMAVILLGAVSSALWLYIYKKLPTEKKTVAVLCLAWSLHCVVFTVVATLSIALPRTLNTWSYAIRIHGLITVLLIAINAALEYCHA
jgi:hypothetical protein